MIIGLDLSVLQTPHRMRGIGATAINFVNNIPKDARKEHRFVLFLHDHEWEKTLELLDLQSLNYELRIIQKNRREGRETPRVVRFNTGLIVKLKRLPAIRHLLDVIRLIKDVRRSIRRIRSGNYIEGNFEDIDAFLQFDQLGPLPRSRKIKKTRILYDVIPYVMESDYLWSYKTARAHGYSKRSSLRKTAQRQLYKVKTRAAAKSADILIAISEHTKKDFVSYMGIHESRIKVVHLGIPQNIKKVVTRPSFKQFIETTWGYIPRPIDLNEKPFLLYMGGADPRRKITDLVAAFNHLRAEGVDIRLVMAGDIMLGAKAITTPEAQKCLLDSSYLEDITFLGFVNDKQKDWLYQNALAFVYPSVYEGFGLPILEAMQYGCPVITYDNSSISEVSGDAAIFAFGPRDIHLNVMNLLTNSVEKRKFYNDLGKKQAAGFSWTKTAERICDSIETF